MIQIEGEATISDGRQVISVGVSFDLVQGRCLISENNAGTSERLLGFSLATKDEVFIENVHLEVGDSELFTEELGPFFLSSSNQAEPTEDRGISESGLASVLGIDSHAVGVDEVELRPFSSRLDFQVVKPRMDDGSEILLHCDPRVKFDCSIELDGEKVRVHTFRCGTVLSKYVRCFSSSLDLSRYTNQLRTAVSLFLRRRAFLHFVRTQSTVSLNLTQPDQAISYGVLVDSPHHYEEILGRLAAASLRPRKHFLIEAFSNPGTIEVRILNAFVHLELVDGGKTLSANRLASVLNIQRESADALVYMRNVMIHDGLSVRDALVETRRRFKTRRGGKTEAEVIEKAFQSESPHGNFYAALMDAFSGQLVREIGFSSDWVKRKTALSL
ncbi:hypothetical protein NLU14_07980 [Marinobacter sp. 71-i]|uniref:ApeA N-terminal domain-containing protein n=1 Tax=Marinobacter iranensis TaxID=2962607 RepID=A0ABT5Y9C6_9GAMM|nr:hypothetical protein [Marinobacter iranensis]MDF0750169.1 hypothetical protein [Marinobacter iranensis]